MDCVSRSIPQLAAQVARLACLAAFVVACAGTSARAQTVFIDDFNDLQPNLTLTFPPAGTTASSSVSPGGTTLGSERDLAVNLTAGTNEGNTLSAEVDNGILYHVQEATIRGTTVVQWDGADASPTLNPTGLGGVDLTLGGQTNALLLLMGNDIVPIDVTLDVYTDAGNASSYTLAMPGNVATNTSFFVPFSAFGSTIGAGADFANVGAVRLTAGSLTASPILIMNGIRTVTTITNRLTVALEDDVNGDGVANPGDRLRYTAEVRNPDDNLDFGVNDVRYDAPTPPYTSLVVGSVVVDVGMIEEGNAPGDVTVAVDLLDMEDGSTRTITYDVLVGEIPDGITEIVHQGTVSGVGLDTPTDDPDVLGFPDPTAIAALGGGASVLEVPALGAWGLTLLAVVLALLALRRFRLAAR